MTKYSAAFLHLLLFLSASAFPVAAETSPIGYEEVSVKAPFAMPAIQVPIFPKGDFNVIEFGAQSGSDISD